jgi:hypothetical protein
MLEIDLSHFWIFNWYYICAVLLSASGIVLAYKNYRKKKENPASTVKEEKISNQVGINITNNIGGGSDDSNKASLNVSGVEKAKAEVRILFIDDNYTEYKMVSILKKSGWSSTRGIKDVTDLDTFSVREAEIIFVDINGVGKSMFADQGLGLALALKQRYPTKKIVIYSAETTGDRFHRALREVDECLPKNAEPYQFIDLVERLSKNS